MKIISFAWTIPAVKARRKTVTRREWDDDYAARFRAGELVTAYDKQPRFGGKKFGVIRLTCKPYKESESLMPDSDYEAEGFAYLDEHPELRPRWWMRDSMKEVFEELRRFGATVWVVRFEVVELEAN